MIRVTFACGHRVDVSEGVKEPPCCKVCGERQVRQVVAPKPTFQFLEAAPVALKE